MLQAIIKRLRTTPPLNHLATTAIKKSFSPWGYPPQRLTKHLPRIGLVEARLPNGRVLHLWSQGDDGIASQVFWEGWNGYIIFEVLPEQGTGSVISEQLVPLGYQFYLLRETGADLQGNIVDHATCRNYLARSTDDRFSKPLNRARRQRAN